MVIEQYNGGVDHGDQLLWVLPQDTEVVAESTLSPGQGCHCEWLHHVLGVQRVLNPAGKGASDGYEDNQSHGRHPTPNLPSFRLALSRYSWPHRFWQSFSA